MVKPIDCANASKSVIVYEIPSDVSVKVAPTRLPASANCCMTDIKPMPPLSDSPYSMVNLSICSFINATLSFAASY